ncbi:MAG: hypothetical protein KAI55_02960 [Candidatus Aenigmarchaeota archaeon]|nr:hypothetical protein [Candidatus Aenigmarchaeota archaeon]
MISKKIVKNNKKEIITGIAIAFFIDLANLIKIAIEPALSDIVTMGDNTTKVYLSISSLVVLAFLIWMVDKQ